MTTTAEAFGLASRYYAAGQLALADQHFRYVLQREPQCPEALHLLGVIALQRGDLTQAIDLLNKAVACGGGDAGYWNNLGVAYTSAGNYPSAVHSYEQALRLRPSYAEAFNNLGIATQHLGERERATNCFEQAIRLRPSYAEAFNNLGNVHKEQGQQQEAATAFEQALRLRPNYAEAANNLGLTLHEQLHFERAEDCYRLALRLKPGYADASNNLATLLKEQGRFDEALAQYQETLRLCPGHVLAYYNLSQFVAEGRYHFAREELDRLKDLITSNRVTGLERSLLCFAIGGTLDRQGCYDEAFGFFQEGNTVRKRLFAQAEQTFDAAEHQALVERIVTDFDPAYFRRIEGWGLASATPIFVIGMPRSGTTLVEHILASHSAVFGAGELGEIPRLLRGWAKVAGYSEDDVPRPLPSRDVTRDLANRFLRRLDEISGGAARVTVKTMSNHLNLGVIATLFPGARIIYCRRGPLDVCLSCYFQNFQSQNFSWSLEDVGTYYRQHDWLMAHWQKTLPLQIHEVCYEELIGRQEAVTRDLLNFCGLPWDERCLSFFNNPRAVRTASTIQVRKPLSTRSVGRWKHYRAHLGPLLAALGPVPAATTSGTKWSDSLSPGEPVGCG